MESTQASEMYGSSNRRCSSSIVDILKAVKCTPTLLISIWDLQIQGLTHNPVILYPQSSIDFRRGEKDVACFVETGFIEGASRSFFVIKIAVKMISI